MLSMMLMAVMTAWMWTTPDGTVWYGDELKRISKLYRDEAVKIRVGDLVDYPRLTCEGACPPKENRDGLQRQQHRGD